MPKVDWEKIDKGDMFLIHGKGWISKLIRRYTRKVLAKQGIEYKGEVWSNHVGICATADVPTPEGEVGRYFIESIVAVMV